MDRYHSEHYRKRISNNRRIKQHLLKIISEHALDLELDQDQLHWLNYEDLLELAVPAMNKALMITLGVGQDWSNGKDAKVSIVRTHSAGKGYSAGITGCRDKKHIQAIVYEPKLDKIYYFDFPVQLNPLGLPMKEHSIPFNLDGTPKRMTRNGANKMWTYECASFGEMAMKSCTVDQQALEPVTVD